MQDGIDVLGVRHCGRRRSTRRPRKWKLRQRPYGAEGGPARGRFEARQRPASRGRPIELAAGAELRAAVQHSQTPKVEITTKTLWSGGQAGAGRVHGEGAAGDAEGGRRSGAALAPWWAAIAAARVARPEALARRVLLLAAGCVFAKIRTQCHAT
jgi:hypothetical protein